MEKQPTCIGQLTIEECSSIEPVLERIAGLEELLLIVEEKSLAANINNELQELTARSKSWWKDTIRKYGWKVSTDSELAIEYETQKVYVYL